MTNKTTQTNSKLQQRIDDLESKLNLLEQKLDCEHAHTEVLSQTLIWLLADQIMTGKINHAVFEKFVDNTQNELLDDKHAHEYDSWVDIQMMLQDRLRNF